MCCSNLNQSAWWSKKGEYTRINNDLFPSLMWKFRFYCFTYVANLFHYQIQQQPFLSLLSLSLQKVFSCIQDSEWLAPTYLSQLFTERQSQYANNRNHLNIFRPRINLVKTSISYSGASLWNSLHPSVKNAATCQSFKTKFHIYLSNKLWIQMLCMVFVNNQANI